MTTNKIKSKAAMMMLLILALCALTTTAQAQTEVTTQTFSHVNYTLWSDGTASVEPSPNAYGTLNLRETLTYENNNYTLTRIADNAFANCTSLTGNLTIPNTVTDIGNIAFYGCTGLTGTLTLPTALKHIGSDAFRECGFTGALNLPDGLLTIGGSAFYLCRGLTGQLNLPATLTSIGWYAFQHCTGFSGTLTLPPLLTEIEPYTFYGVPFTGDFVIPDGVTTISEYAFVVNRFSSIDVGDGVTTIANYAFSGSIATQLTLGRNVTSIGEKAFQCGVDGTPFIYIECKSAIPPTLGADVFKNYGIAWGGITVPCGAKDNYLDPAYGWSGNGAGFVTVMEAESQDVCIDGVYYRLVCSGHTATVMNSAFLESSQGASYSGDVVIPATVEHEGITYNVTHIAQYAFYYCQSLTSVSLGSNIQSIGDDAFGWCTGLDRIVCQGTTPPTMNRFFAFFNVYQNITLQVPCGALEAYQGSNWGVSQFSIMEGTMLENEGLYYQILCGGTTAKLIRHSSYATLASVYLEEFVTYEGTEYPITGIEAGAFDGCAHLQWFDCHANLLSIGDYAFRNCGSLDYLGLYHIDTPPTLGEGVFDGLGLDTLMLIVPFCSQYEYAIHPVWGQFGVIFPDGDCEYNFIGLGADKLWSNPDNWSDGEMPGEGAQVGIMSDCDMDTDVTVGSITIGDFYDEEYGYERLTVKDGATLTATNFIYTSGDARNFVIEDGGQLVHPNAGMKATVKKVIEPWTIESSNGTDLSNGWYLIGYPFAENDTVDEMDNLLSNDYDLYYYDEPTHYWMNQEFAENGFTELEATKGYLYANSQTVTLGLKGTLEAGNATVNVPLSYTATAGNLKGFNLVGNPFAHNVTTVAGTNVAEEVYRMNDTKDELMASTIGDANPLLPGEGFFVKATATDASITFNSRATNAERSQSLSKGRITLDLSKNGKLIDRFILKNGGHPLEKLTLNEHGTRLYATQDGQDYAVAVIGGRDGAVCRDAACHVSTDEMPVNFQAAKDGTYTLVFNLENMDLDYLHLIDNLTGSDVDLLAANGGRDAMHCVSTYTFAAKTMDYASRFRLVFSSSEMDGPSTGSGAFAFISKGNIIINDADACGASLQIVDVMGRVVVSRDAARHVSTSGMPAGVYILRLVNGENVRTQKIVIE